jgi:elongation factor G
MAGEPLRDEFVDAARDGITEALSRGVLAGFPMDDVRVELYDGSCLDPDSSRAGFRMAGAMAFRSAAKEAGPVLLEPVMRVTVTLPIEHVADVMESLAGRHVVMQSREDRGGAHIIQALAPLTQMFGYAADLRSRTRGRGSCSLHLDRYQPVSRQP